MAESQTMLGAHAGIALTELEQYEGTGSAATARDFATTLRFLAEEERSHPSGVAWADQPSDEHDSGTCWPVTRLLERIRVMGASHPSGPVTELELARLKKLVLDLSLIVRSRVANRLGPPALDLNPDETVDLVWVSDSRDRALAISVSREDGGRCELWLRRLDGNHVSDRTDPDVDELAAQLVWFAQGRSSGVNYALTS